MHPTRRAGGHPGVYPGDASQRTDTATQEGPAQAPPKPFDNPQTGCRSSDPGNGKL